MKILYLISSNGAGRGGHYHSLDHISRAIGEHVDVKIVSLGNTESPVLKNNPHYMDYFPFKWWSFFKLNKKFKHLFKSFNPDIIHCFDGGAALLLMPLWSTGKKTLIHTKCGGPNERKIVAQVVGTVILFSKENLKYFKSNRRFNKSDLYHIPNRVFKFDLLPEEKRSIQKEQNVFSFVRISRIGKTYKNSIEQSIELIKQLQTSRPIRLYIIGAIEDPELYSSLKNKTDNQNLPVEWITDEYTMKASQMLYLADAVIGTGRGVMEAMSMNIPVLAPVKNSKLPVLVTDEILPHLMETNFSQRGSIEFQDEKELLIPIERMVRDELFFSEMREFSRKTAEKYFLLNEPVIDQYINIYKKAIKKRKKNYLFKNLFSLLYYINSYRIAMSAKWSSKN